MRITNSMLVLGYLRNLNKNYQKLDKLQNQLTSGKNLYRASDDPMAASKIMLLKSTLNKVSQYTGNVTEAKNWLTQTESALNEMNSLIARAYELTVNAASQTKGVDERSAIANEIGQLTDQLVAAANTSFNGRYIFGGLNTMKSPFEVKEENGQKVIYYNGENLTGLGDDANKATLDALSGQRLNYEISFGNKMDVSYNGIDLFGSGSGNMFNIMNNLKNALLNGDSETIKNSVGYLKEIQDNILSLLGEVGGKTNRLDFFENRLENDDLNLKSMLSKVEDIDIEQVIMDLKMQEVAYEAALASGSKIIVQTLADFIR